MAKQGRPAGSRNKPVAQSTGILTRCPQCDSTQRTPYTTRDVQTYAGVFNGRPYTRIVRRRTTCAVCGQHRVDMLHENEPAGKK